MQTDGPMIFHDLRAPIDKNHGDGTAVLLPRQHVISDEDMLRYFGEIKEAFLVHVDRESIRHGLWKEFPPKDQVHQVKIKTDRVERTLELIGAGTVTIQSGQDAMLEELDDVINYAIFAKIQIKKEAGLL